VCIFLVNLNFVSINMKHKNEQKNDSVEEFVYIKINKLFFSCLMDCMLDVTTSTAVLECRSSGFSAAEKTEMGYHDDNPLTMERENDDLVDLDCVVLFRNKAKGCT